MPPSAFVIIVFAWPLSAADAYGKQLPAAQLAEFKLGCDNPTLAAKCITVASGDDVIYRGLVRSSKRVVAVFDPAAERTVLLEREGLVLAGAPRGARVPEVIKAK